MFVCCSGVEFADDRLGLAVPDSICSDRSVGVVTSGDPWYPSHAATGLAHMLAHTMGARHDHHSKSLSIYLPLVLTLTVPVTTIDALQHFETG